MPALRPTRVLLPGLASVLAACASTSTSPSPSEDPLEGAEERMKVESYSSDSVREQTTLGVYLAQLDRSIQLWNELFLSGDATNDLQRMRGLREDIGFRTRKLFFEIVGELESGPVINRRVAAAAVGFADSEESLSPLLNALSDPDEEVVANALLGLAVLGDSSTPLETVAHFVQFGATPTLRGNAALAALEVLRSGGEGGEAVTEAARAGLRDDAPGVRTQCALVLAAQLDLASIDELGLQLTGDQIPGASMAASRALSYIGDRKIRQKGRVARILTAALGEVEGPVRAAVRNDLRKLAGRNYAEDEDWVEWAHRLPLEPVR